MAAGDVPDAVGHGQHGQAEGQRHADQTDADLRKAAAITALPQPPKVSQNVPMASAASFFVSMDVLPCWDSISVPAFGQANP